MDDRMEYMTPPPEDENASAALRMPETPVAYEAMTDDDIAALCRGGDTVAVE